MNNLLYTHRFNLYRIFMIHLAVSGVILAYLEGDIIIRILMFVAACNCTALLVLDKYWHWMEDNG